MALAVVAAHAALVATSATSAVSGRHTRRRIGFIDTPNIGGNLRAGGEQPGAGRAAGADAVARQTEQHAQRHHGVGGATRGAVHIEVVAFAGQETFDSARGVAACTVAQRAGDQRRAANAHEVAQQQYAVGGGIGPAPLTSSAHRVLDGMAAGSVCIAHALGDAPL